MGNEKLITKTLKEILTDPLIEKISEDAISKWDLSKEDFYNWTLQEIADQMGWRNLERGFSRLLTAAEGGNYYHCLYSEEESKADPAKRNANFVYFPSSDIDAGNRPFILLVPGGGFVNVWNLTEGWPVASIFNELGYNVFILTYRVGVKASALKAMEDIARAMEIIRSRKADFGLKTEDYISCGFSAGGYVVCLWNTEKGYKAFAERKPKACFPIYPVTSFRIMNSEKWEDENEKDVSSDRSVGCTMEDACNSCFEIPEHIADFPPTAIFVAAEDELVDPKHSQNLADALNKADIPCRLEVGPTGGHGFADGEGMCMEGWPERAIRWYESKGRFV